MSRADNAPSCVPPGAPVAATLSSWSSSGEGGGAKEHKSGGGFMSLHLLSSYRAELGDRVLRDLAMENNPQEVVRMYNVERRAVLASIGVSH